MKHATLQKRIKKAETVFAKYDTTAHIKFTSPHIKFTVPLKVTAPSLQCPRCIAGRISEVCPSHLSCKPSLFGAGLHLPHRLFQSTTVCFCCRHPHSTATWQPIWLRVTVDMTPWLNSATAEHVAATTRVRPTKPVFGHLRHTFE